MNGKGVRSTRALLLPTATAEFLPLLALAALGLLLWFSFYTFRALHHAWWQDVDYSHGYLVLALVGWLLVLELRRAPLAPFAPSHVGLVCFFALVLVTTAALAATTQLVAVAALPALWIAAIWAAAGLENARRFAIPLAYLYVAMPIWTFLVAPLRRLTVLVVMSWIRAADLPAFIEGNFIHVPSGTFEVQGGCAGLRYAIIAVALAAFTNLLNRRNWALGVLSMAFALVLALVGNWVRVFVTVAVGQSEMQNAFALVVRDHHTFFGWALFAVFMIPLFWLDRKLQSSNGSARAAQAEVRRESSSASRLGGTYAVCGLLGLGIWTNLYVDQGVSAPASASSVSAPDVLGWQRVGEWQDARRPLYMGATAQMASWYENGGARVGAYVAHYPAQRQEEEVVYYQNRPEGQRGAVVARRLLTLTVDSGAQVPFQELEVADSESERRLVWVGLRVAGTPTASVLKAKILQVTGIIRGRRDAQALVLTAACGDDCGKAHSLLSRYAAAATEPLYELMEAYMLARFEADDRKGHIP